MKPIYILDDNERLTPEMEEIIRLVKESDAVLASGHISTQEGYALAERCKEVGCKLLFVGVSTDMPDYPIQAQKEWAGEHVFMEHVYGAITDLLNRPTRIEVVVDQIRAVGAERCVIATDAGSMKLPPQVDSMKDFLVRLYEAGITEEAIDLTTKRNPRVLLGA